MLKKSFHIHPKTLAKYHLLCHYKAHVIHHNNPFQSQAYNLCHLHKTIPQTFLCLQIRLKHQDSHLKYKFLPHDHLNFEPQLVLRLKLQKRVHLISCNIPIIPFFSIYNYNYIIFNKYVKNFFKIF